MRSKIVSSITITAMFVLIGEAAVAQWVVPANTDVDNKIDVSTIRKKYSVSQTDRSAAADVVLYVDHGPANGDTDGYVWQFSSDYTSVDTAMNYAAVAYDKLNIIGYVDPVDPATIVRHILPNAGYVIDSLFAVLTHENNSGNYDYITMRVVTLNASNQPTSTVLWTHTDSTDTTLSPGGNWVGTGSTFVWVEAPNYSVSNNAGFGVQVLYNNPTKDDTFSIYATYIPDPSTADLYAYQSNILTSWMRYPPYLPSVIRNSNVVYIDTAGNELGYFYAQNWNIWTRLTLTNASTNDDAGVSSFDTPGNLDTLTAANGDSTQVKVWIKNFSTTTNLTSTIANYQLDLNYPVTQYVTGLNVSPGDSALFTFTKYAVLGTPLGSHTINAWTSSASGELDDNESNNSKTAVVYNYGTGINDVIKTNGYALGNAFPNPANTSNVKINYAIGRSGDVEITLRNMLGQEIKKVSEKKVSSGNHTISLDILDLPSGLYVYTMKSGNFIASKKLNIIR